MQKDKKYAFELIIPILFVVAFLVISHNSAMNQEIYSDTQAYYYNYLEINSSPYPYGIEFLLPTIMKICQSLGIEFRWFMFFLLAIWSPVIYKLAQRSIGNVFLLCSLLFFFTNWFQGHILFLMRSYLSFLFFIGYACTDNKKIKSVFFALSFFSHMSALVFLFLYKSHVVKKAVNNKIIAVALLLISIVIQPLIFQLIASYLNFDFIQSMASSDVYRKIGSYSDYDNKSGSVRIIMIVMISVISCLSILYKPKSKDDESVNALIFMETLICITLSTDNIASGRLGFIVMFFTILIITLYMNSMFIDKRSTLLLRECK